MARNAVVLRDGTDADVIALAEDPLEVAVQIFHVRGGRVRGERGWVADRVDEAGTDELIEQFLLQLYADVDPTDPASGTVPREVLVPVEPPEIDASPTCSRNCEARPCGSTCRTAATSGR